MEMILIAQDANPQPRAFQGMVALALDTDFFTSEFRLCDSIAEYLADIVAQSHEDPARYANFSSLIINEIVELAFRTAQHFGKIDFNVVRDAECVRVCVGFPSGETGQAILQAFDRSGNTGSQPGPARDLLTLSQSVPVDLYSEMDGNSRITLIADFFPFKEAD
jgi:hypothetical protein